MYAMNSIGAAMFVGIMALFALLGAFFAMIGSLAFALVCVGVIIVAATGAIHSATR